MLTYTKINVVDLGKFIWIYKDFSTEMTINDYNFADSSPYHPCKQGVWDVCTCLMAYGTRSDLTVMDVVSYYFVVKDKLQKKSFSSAYRTQGPLVPLQAAGRQHKNHSRPAASGALAARAQGS